MWDDNAGRHVCEDCGSEMDQCPGAECQMYDGGQFIGQYYCPECDLQCCVCGYVYQVETGDEITAGFGDDSACTNAYE